MPPIEVGATRAIGAVSAELARKAGADKAGASRAVTGASAGQTTAAAVASSQAEQLRSEQPKSAISKSTLATSDALEPGQAPVDAERVSQIRKAVENGSYPLVPARIADAMIAAGMFLRSSKA